MAQLVGTDPGRMRFLSCGCCGTRWQYSRTGCPFCEADARRLTTLAVDGEAGLRIDSCDLCQAYLKTYDGEGNEAVLLADWTSLHLDVVAHDRGLKRLAASLYELGSAATSDQRRGRPAGAFRCETEESRPSSLYGFRRARIFASSPRVLRISGELSSVATASWHAPQSWVIVFPSAALCWSSWQRKQPGNASCPRLFGYVPQPTSRSGKTFVS